MKCKHYWEVMDKWINSNGTTTYEFYCHYCRKIELEILNNDVERVKK